MIDAPSFPRWDSLGAMSAHFCFIRGQQRHIRRIALVTDSAIGNVAEKPAAHFVAAGIRHFPAGELAAAMGWTSSAA